MNFKKFVKVFVKVTLVLTAVAGIVYAVKKIIDKKNEEDLFDDFDDFDDTDVADENYALEENVPEESEDTEEYSADYICITEWGGQIMYGCLVFFEKMLKNREKISIK